jgi:uncharacterized protein (TIGR02391 family)
MKVVIPQKLDNVRLEAIASVLVDPPGGLRHDDLDNLFYRFHIPETREMGVAKRIRLFNAFASSLNRLQDPTQVRLIIEYACSPSRFLQRAELYEMYRQGVNEALSFVGWAAGSDGVVRSIQPTATLPEAERRARDLRDDLIKRDIHPDVLKYCRAELIADDYFHAVLEASKSVFAKIRKNTGLDLDGAELVDRAFGGTTPLWVINSYANKSHRSEQTGFMFVIKGLAGMFRNPTAHEPRVEWQMSKEDAEDIFSLVSMIHRRIDSAKMPPRV